LGIIFLCAITVLFGRIIEESSAFLEVGEVIFGATVVKIGAEKGLRHGEFGDDSVDHGFSFWDSAS